MNEIKDQDYVRYSLTIEHVNGDLTFELYDTLRQMGEAFQAMHHRLDENDVISMAKVTV